MTVEIVCNPDTDEEECDEEGESCQTVFQQILDEETIDQCQIDYVDCPEEEAPRCCQKVINQTYLGTNQCVSFHQLGGDDSSNDTESETATESESEDELADEWENEIESEWEDEIEDEDELDNDEYWVCDHQAPCFTN